MRIHPEIRRDRMSTFGGTLKLIFVDEDIEPFDIPLDPTSEQTKKWEMWVPDNCLKTVELLDLTTPIVMIIVTEDSTYGELLFVAWWCLL